MKLAIISTTINGEKGYLPFDSLAKESKFSNVIFVIAGDMNSAPFDTSKFKCEVEYLTPKDQERFYVSQAIGWNTPRRRPVAWLRAVELKPDYILSIDDDNIPSPDYFERWYDVLIGGVAAVVEPDKNTSGIVWHNYLKTSDAPIEIYPRGFPIPFRGKRGINIKKAAGVIKPVEIGLYQGISLGDPDIDAMTRLVWPKRTPLNSIGDKNYCLRNVWSPYNMQNTVFSKILFPLPVLWPHAGRFDDIYASFVWQKFLFNNNMYVHVGDPVNRQDRGVRDTLNGDFREEVGGYIHSHHVWEAVNCISEKDPMIFMERLTKVPVFEYKSMATVASYPGFFHGVGSSNKSTEGIIEQHRKFFEAHLKDIERILQ